VGTAYSIGLRYRAISDWCYRSGVYYAGWPTFHQADYFNPRRIVYGHLLLRDAVVDWRDVAASEYNLSDLRSNFTGAHDYALRQGYQHGFRNWHEAASGPALKSFYG
jgi:hypothetical protein